VEKEQGVHVSFNSLIVKAVANTLEDFPILSGLRSERLDRIICPKPKETNIAFPVQMGNTAGMILVENANQKGLVELSKEMNARIKRLKESNHPEVEYWNTPLFCISNLGTIGQVESCFGQMGGNMTGGLVVCSIMKKPVVRKDEITIREMMNTIVCWDHFAMMANTPIEFLNELKRNLEEPDTHLM
jgi:pyruvate dehydrogenase E2 component (dihydrolipoamide acetyltransferase)